MSITELNIPDNSSIGICILDDQYNVLLWNKTFENWTSIKKEEILNTNIKVRYPHLMEEKYSRKFKEVLEATSSIILATEEYVHIFPSFSNEGTLISLKTELSIVSDQENNKGILILCHDITEALK